MNKYQEILKMLKADRNELSALLDEIEVDKFISHQHHTTAEQMKLLEVLIEKETPKKIVKISSLVGKYCPTCGSHLTISLNPRRNLRCYFCGQLFELD